MKLARTKEWRESHGLTQRELAAEAGVGEVTVARIESGASVTPPTARKVADALGVSVADLLERPPVPLGEAPQEAGWQVGTPRVATPRITAVRPTGRGPNVTQEMLAELGIEATNAELNALNIYLEGRARQRVEGGPTAIPSLARDNVDVEKVAGWAPVVEDALSYWITTGRFNLVPGAVSGEETEAVRRHAREKLAELAQHSEG